MQDIKRTVVADAHPASEAALRVLAEALGLAAFLAALLLAPLAARLGLALGEALGVLGVCGLVMVSGAVLAELARRRAAREDRARRDPDRGRGGNSSNAAT